MQTVHISLSPGESVFCQTHSMAWMSDDVQMNTNTRGGFFKSAISHAEKKRGCLEKSG